MLRPLLVVLTFLSVALASAQEDWAQLGRYADANAALGAPARDESRIIFLGDSITEGWSQSRPEFFSGQSYVARGIAGQTTAQMLVRFRADVVALDPSAVVILAGTNDIAGAGGPATNAMIQDNLASMAEIAAENDIRVILASILPTDGYPWAPDVEPAFRIFAINRWLEDYAEQNDHIYVDYYAAMVNDQGGMQAAHTTDGVHVSQAGYAIMEGIFEVAVNEAPDRPRSQEGTLRFTPIDGCARTTSSRRNVRCD